MHLVRENWGVQSAYRPRSKSCLLRLCVFSPSRCGGELSFSRAESSAARWKHINFGPRRDITAYKANFHISLDIAIKNYPFSFSGARCAFMYSNFYALFPDLSLCAVDFYFSRSVLKVKHSHRTNRALSYVIITARCRLSRKGERFGECTRTPRRDSLRGLFVMLTKAIISFFLFLVYAICVTSSSQVQPKYVCLTKQRRERLLEIRSNMAGSILTPKTKIHATWELKARVVGYFCSWL